MNIWDSVSGMVTLELTSAEPEKLFDCLTWADIPVFRIRKKTDLVYRTRIFRRDYAKVSRLLDRMGASAVVVHRQGIYWFLRALWSRPVLMGALVLLFFLTVLIPTKILFIEVSGNQTLPEARILEAAQGCGICFGADRSRIRSEKVKNALLSALPQLQWAGINTSGCRAVISVRERTKPETKPQPHVLTNIVSEQDAYILSATVTSGTGMVSPGDSVTRGQLLISGYTNCGLYLQAGRASGEILAQTSRNLTAAAPVHSRKILSVTDTKYGFSLLIGKKRINLWKDSRISDALCGRMYEEYFVSLPGGFCLPLAVCVDRYFDYGLQTASQSEVSAKQALENFSDQYLIRQMTAGQILQQRRSFAGQKGAWVLKSTYVCSEIIGKECREQIGDLNGKGN